MKIKYKTDKVSFYVECDPKDKDIVLDLVSKLCKESNPTFYLSASKMDKIKEAIDQIPDEPLTYENHINPKVFDKEKTKSDRPVVRQRLPNEIDLSDVEIQKAMTRKESHLTCPNCYQSSFIVVKISDSEYYYMRRLNNNYEVVAKITNEEELKGMDFKTDDPDKDAKKIIDYYTDIYRIKEMKLDVNVDNKTSVYCPICKTVHKVQDWIKCGEDPISYGCEYSDPCAICGGETVKKINKLNTTKTCERCGHKEILKKED